MEVFPVKRILLLVLALALLAPAASADFIIDRVLKEFEAVSDSNFQITCNYDASANVGCMQMVYQLPYRDIYQLFTDDAVEDSFNDLMALSADRFHTSMNYSDLHPSTILTAVSNDSLLLCIYVNGVDVSWMKTNWNGHRPF